MAHKIWTMLLLCSVPLKVHAASSTVEYVVMDLRNNPDLRDQWNTDAQQVLFAHVDGVEYQIIPNDPDWNTAYLEIEAVADLDNDGEPEAIISTSHGGNCCGPNVFVVSHRGEGFFTAQSHEHLTGWPYVSLVEQADEKILKVSNWSFDQSTGQHIDEESLFRFRYGALELLSHNSNVGLVPAVVEVTARELKKGPKALSFDIDGDGVPEAIRCSFWERWQSASCKATYTGSHDNQLGDFQLACWRVGFLAATTDGFNDVVCGARSILRFDESVKRYELID